MVGGIGTTVVVFQCLLEQKAQSLRPLRIRILTLSPLLPPLLPRRNGIPTELWQPFGIFASRRKPGRWLPRSGMTSLLD